MLNLILASGKQPFKLSGPVSLRPLVEGRFRYFKTNDALQEMHILLYISISIFALDNIQHTIPRMFPGILNSDS